MTDQTAKTISTALTVLEAAASLWGDLASLREGATTDQKDRLDKLEAAFTSRSNAVADKLRDTPDDPAG